MNGSEREKEKKCCGPTLLHRRRFVITQVPYGGQMSVRTSLYVECAVAEARAT
jgi:hypothetical protein